MIFYQLSLRGDPDDDSLALVDKAPAEIGFRKFYCRVGKPFGATYPPDLKMHLAKHSKGIKLASLLSNLLSYLILNTEAKNVFLTAGGAEIEVLPVTLINHKGRVHSTDYSILNPIGSLDCIHQTASKITYGGDTGKKFVAFGWEPGSIVFDSNKLGDAPDIFRIPEQRDLMFVSERLARSIKIAKLTNVLLVKEMRTEPAS